MNRALTAVVLLGLLSACGQVPDEVATQGVPDNFTKLAPEQVLVPDGYAGRYQFAGTVLENEVHGPQLCFAVATSLPPQCGGPDLIDWSWKAVKHESMSGVRWGDYQLIGFFDGTSFTVTEVSDRSDAEATEPATPLARGDRTPCPAPPDGWQPVDPAKATQEASDAAMALAQASPDYAGLWIDQGDQVSELNANDPAYYVLNVSYTANLAKHAAELREVWGGALCVSAATRTEAELLRLQDELSSGPMKPQSTATDVYTNSVHVEVPVAFVADQAAADAQYGAGTVVLTSLLRPLD